MTAQPFPQRVTVTIDTLVLRDFPASAREPIADSLRMELKRLLATGENRFGSSRAITAFVQDRLQLPTEPSPPRIGALAAAHIARGVLR